MNESNSQHPPIFLKLGGSLITDKTKPETIREDVLHRVAQEIATAKKQNPSLRLVLGHGSGSFGHVAGAKYGTRQGVKSPWDWYGFTAVSDAALRLNRAVTSALFQAGIPAISVSPSASAVCTNGRLHTLDTSSIQRALAHSLVPVIHGDVAFDTEIGGTIVSTEEVMVCLAPTLQPEWLLLAGETDGVYDLQKQTIPHIDEQNLPAVQKALGGSRGTDVTGGMASKVASMLNLTKAQDRLKVRVFSGLQEGNIQTLLQDQQQTSKTIGTILGTIS